MTARHWCFTSYETEKDFMLNEPIFVAEKMRYLTYQLEICPDTGRHHWQGYVEFLSPVRGAGVCKAIGMKTARTEARRGTRTQAMEYCQKEESRHPDFHWVEWGEWLEDNQSGTPSGTRMDLKMIIKECNSVKDVKEKHPDAFVRYHNGFEKLYKDEYPRKTGPIVWIFWGNAGTGKSTIAKTIGDYLGDGPDESDPINNVYKKPIDNWLGYKKSRLTIMDEFSFEKEKFSNLLQWFDPNGGAASVGWKYGEINFDSPFIIITSNEDPKKEIKEKLWPQFRRRISKIVHFDFKSNDPNLLDSDPAPDIVQMEKTPAPARPAVLEPVLKPEILREKILIINEGAPQLSQRPDNLRDEW